MSEPVEWLGPSGEWQDAEVVGPYADGKTMIDVRGALIVATDSTLRARVPQQSS
jgi:hypothetical protein